jgi:hypothetical protein
MPRRGAIDTGDRHTHGAVIRRHEILIRTIVTEGDLLAGGQALEPRYKDRIVRLPDDFQRHVGRETLDEIVDALVRHESTHVHHRRYTGVT